MGATAAPQYAAAPPAGRTFLWAMGGAALLGLVLVSLGVVWLVTSQQGGGVTPPPTATPDATQRVSIHATQTAVSIVLLTTTATPSPTAVPRATSVVSPVVSATPSTPTTTGSPPNGTATPRTPTVQPTFTPQDQGGGQAVPTPTATPQP
jgi:cytoskeletal protein RodZ